MGYIEVEAKISNIEETKETKVIALIDTGATLSVVTEKIANELNLKRTGEKVKVLTAKGSEDLDLAHAIIEIKGKKRISPVLISKHLDKVLIGVVTLESMNLKVNPMTQELEEHYALLY